MKESLAKLGLNSTNSVVIGSGILQALGIRESNDIDVVTTEKIWNHLKESGIFNETPNHGNPVLVWDKFEIGTSWKVLGKTYKFEDFDSFSVTINGVKYITLDFLYRVKKSWLSDKDVQQKARGDIELIKNYLKLQSN